jgi:acetate kinase
MVEEKITQLFSWHFTIQRTWNTSLQLFYIGKTNGCFDTAHQTIPVIAHKYAIPNKFLTKQ